MKTKRISLSVSPDDTNAIMCALSVLPACAYYDPTASVPIDTDLIKSTIAKLSKQKPLNRNEQPMIKIAIDMAHNALYGKTDVPPDVLEDLQPYFFTINKLYNAL